MCLLVIITNTYYLTLSTSGYTSTGTLCSGGVELETHPLSPFLCLF